MPCACALNGWKDPHRSVAPKAYYSKGWEMGHFHSTFCDCIGCRSYFCDWLDWAVVHGAAQDSRHMLCMHVLVWTPLLCHGCSHVTGGPRSSTPTLPSEQVSARTEPPALHSLRPSASMLSVHSSPAWMQSGWMEQSLSLKSESTWIRPFTPR